MLSQNTPYPKSVCVLEKRQDGPWPVAFAHPLSGNTNAAVTIVFPQVKNLTEEGESLNEEISKLNRVAKVMQEAHQQTLDDLVTEGEKLSSLSTAKLKLEWQVDEVGSVVSR